MKKIISSQEWEQIVQEHPELAQEMESFFENEKGVASVVGFYAMLKMRLWRLLAPQSGPKNIGGSARDDHSLPPQAGAGS